MSNSLMGDKEPDISGRQHDPRENGKTKKAPQFVAAFAGELKNVYIISIFFIYYFVVLYTSNF